MRAAGSRSFFPPYPAARPVRHPASASTGPLPWARSRLVPSTAPTAVPVDIPPNAPAHSTRKMAASLPGDSTPQRLTGSKANEVIAVLLDHATLRSADASARRQSLTVTLENGLRLQLGVSGDTLCGCGGWSCPEFFEAFEAAL